MFFGLNLTNLIKGQNRLSEHCCAILRLFQELDKSLLSLKVCIHLISTTNLSGCRWFQVDNRNHALTQFVLDLVVQDTFLIHLSN